MMAGTYKNPSVPYGYDYVNGKLKIDPEKAEVVKQVFYWYISGIGTSEIADRLNLSGVRKEVWRHGTVYSILTNEKYIGDTLWQKQFTTDTLPFRQVKNVGEKPEYYISNTHPPIIERTVFDEVQKLLSSRKPNTDFTPRQSAFRRKINCICGGTFRRKKNGGKIYWICRNHDHRNISDCHIRQIGEWVFQTAFIRMWNKLQAHHKTIISPMLRQLETLYKREKSDNAQLVSLRREISEIKQQMHLLAMLNSQGTLDEAYFKERSQEFDRKLMITQKQLCASLDDKESERLGELRKLMGILEKAEPMTEFDEIKFGQIVDKITVLSETEIRFGLIGKINFTEHIKR